MAGELGLAAVLAQRGWEALSDRLVGAEAAPAPPRLGHARGARGVSKRMARPVCKRLMHSDLISLLQRIRPRSRLPAKMEIRASRSL
jgi:hypothetical protein